LSKSLFRSLALALLLFSAHVIQAKPQLGIATERLLELRGPSRLVFNQALPTQFVENKVYIPLEEFAFSLGFKINVLGDDYVAKGFLYNNKEEFYLDLKECSIETPQISKILIKGNQEDCPLGYLYENDFYIPKELLEKWFELKVEIEPFRSIISIRPKRTLPSLQEKERKQIQAQLLNRKAQKNTLDEGSKAKTKGFHGPFIDQDFHSSVSKRPNTKAENVNVHKIQAETEFLGIESKYSHNYDLRGYYNHRLTFLMRDPDGLYQGPLKVRQISAYDVYLQSAPSVLYSRQGKGFTVSSFPLLKHFRFDERSLRLEGPPEWDAELYHNSVLVAAGRTDKFGVLIFENIEIFHGKNNYKVIYYGPHGEVQEHYEDLNVDDNFLKRGDYNFAFGLVENLDRTNYQALGKVGLSKKLNLDLSFNRLSYFEGNDFIQRNFSSFGLSGHESQVNYEANYIHTNQKAYAIDTQLRSSLGSQRLSLNYTYLNNFVSDIYPQQEADRGLAHHLRLNHFSNLWGRTGLKSTYSTKLFQPYSFEEEIESSFLFRTGAINWQKSLKQTHIPSERFWSGELRALFFLFPFRVQSSIDYTFESIEEIASDVSYSIDRWDLKTLFNTTHNLINEVTTFKIGAQKSFSDLIGVGVQSSYATDKNAYIGIDISNSIGSVRNMSRFISSNERLTDVSYAEAIVFHDKNFNGTWDKDSEESLENIPFTINPSHEIVKTNSEGRALFKQLSNFETYELQVNSVALSNMNLRASNMNQRIQVRPNTLNVVEFPATDILEAEGFVLERSGETIKEVRGATLIVHDLSETKVGEVRSSFDGYFLIEDLPPGSYTIEVDSEYLKKRRLKASPSEHAFELDTKKNQIKSELNFELVNDTKKSEELN